MEGEGSLYRDERTGLLELNGLEVESWVEGIELVGDEEALQC